MIYGLILSDKLSSARSSITGDTSDQPIESTYMTVI